MQFSSRASLAACLAIINLVAASPFANELVTRQSQSGQCATGLHLMIGGGCDIPCPSDLVSYLSTLVGNVTAAFPGSDQYVVPYNDSQVQANVSSPLMIKAVKEYFQECPDTPVVFLGYSLGAIITMNTLCGGIDYTPNVLAAIVYGDETYTYPQTYDAGTCQKNAPLYARANNATCEPFAPAIKSYCNADDPACCGGDNLNSHFTYPALYDVAATEFIKQRYAARGSSIPSSSVVPSSSTSSLTSPGTALVSVTSGTSTASSTDPSTTNSNSVSTSTSSTVDPPSTSTDSTSTSSTVDPPSTTTDPASSSTITSSTLSIPVTTSTTGTLQTSTPSMTPTSVTGTSAVTTLPPQTSYSVVPYTGAANRVPAGTFVQVFVAIAVYGLI